MEIGHFYFICDQYFIDFPDPTLERNKEAIKGQFHDRPCFYAFQDQTTNLFWMVPFSSKISKFQTVYQHKVLKYGSCDTLVFGNVLGYPKAFLLQNMCPIISEYIANEYMDKIANIPVRVDSVLERDIIQKAKKILTLARQGRKVIFPDVFKIERQLLNLK